MRTISEYTAAVERLLPAWLPGKREMIADLRSHLTDRMVAGETEGAAIEAMDPPQDYAAALVRDIPLHPAPFGRRIGAFLVDGLIGVPVVAGVFLLWELLMVTFVAGWPGGMVRQWWEMMGSLAVGSIFIMVMLGVVALSASVLVLSFVYFPAAEAIWGTTVGKKLFGLYVVAENGTRVTWIKAIVRRIPFYFEFFWLDGLVALFTRKRQRAFDHVAGTLVIHRAA